MAVAALAIGPFLYRSLLPGTAEAPGAGCSFLLVIGSLFVLLAVAAVWLLRRRERDREPRLDRRLWEAMLREGGDAGAADGDGPEPGG